MVVIGLRGIGLRRQAGSRRPARRAAGGRRGLVRDLQGADDAVAPARPSAAGGRIPPLIVGVQEGGIYRAYPGLPPALGQREIGGHRRPRPGDRAGPLATGRALSQGRLRPQPGAGRRRGDARQRALRPRLQRRPGAGHGDDRGGGARLPRGRHRLRRLPLPRARRRPRADIAARSGDRRPRRGLARGARPRRPSGRRSPRRSPAMVLSLAFYAAYDPVTPAALSPASPATCCATSSASRASRSPTTSPPGAIAAGVGAPRGGACRRWPPAPTWS